jgi:tripartite-type tricarboxylate transporter receptor subunit TctC
LIAGRIDLLFGGIPIALPIIENKQARPIAVTSTTRSRKLPDLPTFVESGISDYEIRLWIGIMAPAGTPDAIVSRLNSAISSSLESPSVVSRMRDLGLDEVNGNGVIFKQPIKAASMK